MKTKPCPFYFWSLEPCSHSVRRKKTAGYTWGHREGLRPAGAESCWAGAQGPRKSKKHGVGRVATEGLGVWDTQRKRQSKCPGGAVHGGLSLSSQHPGD